MALSALLCAAVLSAGAGCGNEKHWLEYVGYSAPTCTEAGNVAHWKCTECGKFFLDGRGKEETETVDIEPLGHAYAEELVGATCTKKGTLSRRCLRCGDTESEELTSVEHLFGAYRTTKAATCAEDGEEKRSCVLCGQTETRTVPKTELHSWKDHRCTVCGIECVPTEGLRYELLLEGGTAVGYTVAVGEATGNVVIPYSHAGLPIARIEERGFAESSVTNVAVYAPLTEIARSAFDGCSDLLEIALPATLRTVGRESFARCGSLRCIRLPDSVVSVGKQAFYSCSNVTELFVGKGLSEIGEMAFWNLRSLRTITVSKDNSAFSGEGNCLVERATGKLLLGSNAADIPDGVTAICAFAFLNCQELVSVVIPRSVKKIGDSAFRECAGLTEIVYLGSEEEWQTVEKGQDWNAYTDAAVRCTG